MYTGLNHSPTGAAPPASVNPPSAPPSAGSNTAPHSPAEEKKTSHSGANGLNARSCVTCRRRKGEM